MRDHPNVFLAGTFVAIQLGDGLFPVVNLGVEAGVGNAELVVNREEHQPIQNPPTSRC
jgi:hypothetical protein